jgi:hypothetical protein
MWCGFDDLVCTAGSNQPPYDNIYVGSSDNLVEGRGFFNTFNALASLLRIDNDGATKL